MHIEEKIILSLTSWHKRINNVLPVLRNMESQTLVPDLILLNLCTEDFPDKEASLPRDLVHYIEEKTNIEIYWFMENYKGWKKHLRALEIVDEDDLIICADDDQIMPETFIENLYRSYVHYGKRFPVTSNRNGYDLFTWPFCGCGTLYRKKDWGDYKKYLTHEILTDTLEDSIINLLFAHSGAIILPCIYKIGTHKEYEFNTNDPLTPTDARTYEKKYREGMKYMNEIALKMFGTEHKFGYSPEFFDVKIEVIKKIESDPELMELPQARLLVDNFKKGDMHFFKDMDKKFVQTYLDNEL